VNPRMLHRHRIVAMRRPHAKDDAARPTRSREAAAAAFTRKR
jgi:hypothetical protein